LLARALRCPVQTMAGTDHRTLARNAATLAAIAEFVQGLLSESASGLDSGTRGQHGRQETNEDRSSEACRE
jgi:hypothetical protein